MCFTFLPVVSDRTVKDVDRRPNVLQHILNECLGAAEPGCLSLATRKCFVLSFFLPKTEMTAGQSINTDVCFYFRTMYPDPRIPFWVLAFLFELLKMVEEGKA